MIFWNPSCYYAKAAIDSARSLFFWAYRDSILFGAFSEYPDIPTSQDEASQSLTDIDPYRIDIGILGFQLFLNRDAGGQAVSIRLPFWFVVISIAALAAAPWFKVRWQFSMRAMLITMTAYCNLVGMCRTSWSIVQEIDLDSLIFHYAAQTTATARRTRARDSARRNCAFAQIEACHDRLAGSHCRSFSRLRRQAACKQLVKSESTKMLVHNS
jgi:hypothetical protein